MFALSRLVGVKTRDLKQKLGDGADLPSVDETRSRLTKDVTAQLKTFIGELRTRHKRELTQPREHLAVLKRDHRGEREALERGQAERWRLETEARAKRLRTGLAGLWDKLSGRATAIKRENEAEALKGLARDRGQRDELSASQRAQRQPLQIQLDRLRERHTHDRKLLAREIAAHLRKRRAAERAPDATLEPPRRHRTRGFSLDL